MKMYKVVCFFIGVFVNYAYASYAYELSITTIFQNEGPYLKEWVEYHRMVGVEHFWLYNDASTDNWKEELQPYISEGIVEVIDWPSGGFGGHIPNQIGSMVDALERSRGVTKWIALIDADEFILPLKEATVTECLAKHFADASGIYVNWRHFGTSGIYLKEGQSLLFTLKACSHRHHSQNAIGKSIVKPDQVDRIWSGHHFNLKPGAKYCYGDSEPITFTGSDLCTDGKLHDKFIRINHYTMRDEHFFYNTRLVRARGIGIEERLVWEHYNAFNLIQDKAIINFILRKHPESYERFWKSRVYK